MRKLLNWTAFAAVLICVIGLTMRGAQADEFVFGASTYDGLEELNLTTTAGLVTITTNGNQGWWSATEFNTANTNYIAGSLEVGSTVFNYNDFFSFNLSPLVGTTVTSGSLSVTTFFGSSTLGYPSLTYAIGSVNTPAAILDAEGGPSPAIYADLGKGNYGSVEIPISSSPSSATVIPLNGLAISELNAAIGNTDNGGFFSIGGTVTAVPEPSGIVAVIGLLGMGMIGLARRVRRSR